MVAVFFVGDILMSARLIIIGIFAIIDRLRKRKNYATPEYAPRVAVLIPAYNEEKVIVRTIRSVMMSNYKNIRIIVIDDGSTDRTYDVARDAYPADIASGRLTVLTKPNGGKAEALNFALEQIDEEIYVGIDADGVIAHDAIARAGAALCESEDRRRRGQCQGRQPRQPVDALAGARVHHEPELRAARAGSFRCGDGGSGRDWRVAHGGGEGGGRIPLQYCGRRRRPDDEPAGAGLLL